MSGDVILIMVQVDDAPGELLGEVISRLEKLGAKNVQLLSSLTKKGRPGYVMMIDIPAERERDVAGLLAGELGIWGYRVLHSDHKHFDIRTYKAKLEISIGGQFKVFPLRVKRILHDGTFLRAKAEHDDLSTICAALTLEKISISLAVLKSRVEAAPGQRRARGKTYNYH
jgi:uncharacterized protein (DUF111 family)